MRLATSFRFGAKISDTANALLALQGESRPAQGTRRPAGLRRACPAVQAQTLASTASDVLARGAAYTSHAASSRFTWSAAVILTRLTTWKICSGSRVASAKKYAVTIAEGL